MSDLMIPASSRWAVRLLVDSSHSWLLGWVTGGLKPAAALPDSVRRLPHSMSLRSCTRSNWRRLTRPGAVQPRS